MITEDHFDIKQDITNNKNITVKKKFSKDLVEAHLLNALNLDIPKSLAQVCREGGFSVRAAKNNFPLLSKRIKDKYANYQKEKRLQKQKIIENVLNDCLNMDVPISLKECLEKIGVPPTTAKRYADDLCKKVAERYDEYKKNLSIERKDKLSKELESVILNLHQKGLYPSINKIQEVLPGILREKVFYDLRKKILNSLGYKV